MGKPVWRYTIFQDYSPLFFSLTKVLFPVFFGWQEYNPRVEPAEGPIYHLSSIPGTTFTSDFASSTPCDVAQSRKEVCFHSFVSTCSYYRVCTDLSNSISRLFPVFPLLRLFFPAAIISQLLRGWWTPCYHLPSFYQQQCDVMCSVLWFVGLQST